MKHQFNYLIKYWIINYTYSRDLVDGKTNRYTYIRKPAEKQDFDIEMHCNIIIGYKKKRTQCSVIWLTNPCTKFVVPSRGSTIQVGSSVSSSMPEIADVSSPMN